MGYQRVKAVWRHTSAAKHKNDSDCKSWGSVEVVRSRRGWSGFADEEEEDNFYPGCVRRGGGRGDWSSGSSVFAGTTPVSTPTTVEFGVDSVSAAVEDFLNCGGVSSCVGGGQQAGCLLLSSSSSSSSAGRKRGRGRVGGRVVGRGCLDPGFFDDDHYYDYEEEWGGGGGYDGCSSEGGSDLTCCCALGDCECDQATGDRNGHDNKDTYDQSLKGSQHKSVTGSNCGVLARVFDEHFSLAERGG